MKPTKQPKIIAIDGPAGSGKSTIASLVSRALGWNYLNTGTLYRLIGFLAQEQKIRISEDDKLRKLIEDNEDSIEWRDGVFYYKHQDITTALQAESIGKLASEIATSSIVRTLLLPIQRKLAMQAREGVIIDGRDIGTVVFPNANLKIFMTANLETRAQRRYKQLADKKVSPLPSMESLILDIQARDKQDELRTHAPLQKASDAINFDTSHISIEECITRIVSLIQKM